MIRHNCMGSFETARTNLFLYDMKVDGRIKPSASQQAPIERELQKIHDARSRFHLNWT